MKKLFILYFVTFCRLVYSMDCSGDYLVKNWRFEGRKFNIQLYIYKVSGINILADGYIGTEYCHFETNYSELSDCSGLLVFTPKTKKQARECSEFFNQTRLFFTTIIDYFFVNHLIEILV